MAVWVLPVAHVPHQGHVLLLVQVLPLGQPQHPGLVDGGDGGEVELVESTKVREVGLGDEALLGVLLSLGHLQLQQA